jgi:hypothetical protein
MQGIDVRLTTRGEAAAGDMAAAEELPRHAVWLLRLVLNLSGRVSIVTLSWRASPSFSPDAAQAAAMVAVAKLVELASVVAVVVAASVVVLADGAAGSMLMLASPATAGAALGLARGALPPPRGEYDLVTQYVDAALSARACEEKT